MTHDRRVTYRRVISQWQESVCAENPMEYYPGEWVGLPRADRPDSCLSAESRGTANGT